MEALPSLLAEFAGLAVAVVVPLFVAMDPLGALPLVLAWTGHLPTAERERQLRDALLTASAIGVIFAVGGGALLSLLGIGVADFLVAGGAVLLVLAVRDLALSGEEPRGQPAVVDFGVVPIGTPLLAGPATLTTILILVGKYGLLPTLLALGFNLLLAWWLFRQAGVVTRLLGQNGLRALSKIVSLVLAAIAVRLIREGVFTILQLPSP
jgi:multiple antibiotic resistance protein